MKNKILSLLKGLCGLLILFLTTQVASAQCVQEVWFDDFNDLSKWDYELGDGCGTAAGCGFGNGELQNYTNSASNVSVAGGKLSITATYNSATNSYTSGKLNTKNRVGATFTYGKIEVNAKLSSGGGAWPAFWMLPVNNQWPMTGEIDILEAKHKNPSQELGTIHYNYGAHQYTGGQITTTDLSTSFHTYGVQWQKDKITWYLDGVEFYNVTPAGTVGGAWPFNDTSNPFYLILNLAVGGPGSPFTGNISATPGDFPTTFQVDWVRVSSGTWNVAVTGNQYAYQGSSNNIYSVTPVSGGTYNWTVPTGATIASGQGTPSITVNWGASSGDVSVAIATSCGTNTYKQAVIAEAAFTVDKILEDFQTNRNLTFKSATGTFVNGIANPSATAPNTSATAGKYTRNAAEQYDVLAYKNVDMGNANDFVNRKRRLQMDLYTAAPVGTKITLQFENTASSLSTNYPTGRHSIYEAIVAKQNAWQTLEFKYVSSPDPNVGIFGVDQLVFLFNSNTTTADAYYFDNLITGTSGTAPAGALYQTLLNYDGTNNLTYKASSGVYGGQVANPSITVPNTSANVGKYTRSSSDLYDVLFFNGQVGDAGLLRSEKDYFKIDVYTAAPIGTIISIQLENSALSLTGNYPTGRHSVYQAKTTKTNAWETIRFYYSSSPDGGALPSVSVDQVVILTNPNSSTNHIYYFDNMQVFTTDPNRNVPFALETTLEDYQTNRNITFTTATGTYVNGQASPGGTNTTTTGKYSRNASELYDVLNYNTASISDAGPFKQGSKKFAMDIYTSAAVGSVISFQLETAASIPSNYPTGRNSLYQAVTTKQNQWETVTFSYASSPDGGSPNNAITKIVMLLKPGTSSGDIFYIDNIRSLSQGSVIDTQAPTSPASLASPSKTATSVNLTWTASTDNSGSIAGYEIYVNTETTPRATVTGTSTTIGSLTASTAYTFKVRAKDAVPNFSAYSNTLSVTTNAATIAVTSVSVTPTSATLTAGATQQLTATIAPANATDQTKTWSSSNTAVATVNTSGLVTAIAAGSAIITVTTQDGAKSATSAFTINSSAALPSPWITSDIGAVAATGSASHNNGTFTVIGSGGDIWNTADEFRYVYRPITGDVTITARVVTLGNTDGWAKAGVMIRESTAANSIHTFTGISYSNGVEFQRRTATGAASTNNSGVAGAAPYWVRLVRAGNVFSSYLSSNGTTWTQIGASLTITMTSQTQVGLAVTSHNNGVLTTSTFDNVTVTTTSNVLVTGVTVSPTSAALAAGATQQLTATISPANATNQTKTWSSSNTAVATVSTSGLVTAIGAGSAIVTVTTQDGNKTATSSITVTSGSSTCSGTAVSGDYTYQISSSGGNVNWTFVPGTPIAGSTLCILYVKVGTGGYAGYTMTASGSNFTKSVAFATGSALNFYFTYRVGATTAERNSSANPHLYTAGATCGGRTASEVVTEIDEESHGHAIHPNPVHQSFTMRGSKGGTMSILNAQGTELSKEFMETNHKDVSHLPAGLYHVVLIKHNQKIIKRFVKE